MSEATIRDKLARQERGQTEVYCPVGRVDILTETEVIEVKSAKEWKAALGQAVAYKYFYPSKTPRIHLYRHCPKETRYLIEIVCKSDGVRVTWDG